MINKFSRHIFCCCCDFWPTGRKVLKPYSSVLTYALQLQRKLMLHMNWYCYSRSIHRKTKTWLKKRLVKIFKPLHFTCFHDSSSNHFIDLLQLGVTTLQCFVFLHAPNRIWLVAMLPLRSWRRSCALNGWTDDFVWSRMVHDHLSVV